MTAIRQRHRRPKATRRLPLAELGALMRRLGGKCPVRLGLVYAPDNGLHYSLETEGSTLVDILVHVETVPERVSLECRLGTVVGGSGRGIWAIPAVGDEVLVAVPDGDITFAPTIVAILSTGDIPNPSGQGPTMDRTIIVNGEVLIHDGAGGAAALAKADHKHELPALAGASYVGSPSGTDTWSASDSNTIVLKAK